MNLCYVTRALFLIVNCLKILYSCNPDSSLQLQSLAEVSLKFAGPNLHLTNDMFSSHKLHEIMVLQQHCGGSTLCVFRELLPPNSKQRCFALHFVHSEPSLSEVRFEDGA